MIHRISQYSSESVNQSVFHISLCSIKQKSFLLTDRNRVDILKSLISKVLFNGTLYFTKEIILKFNIPVSLSRKSTSKSVLLLKKSDQKQ